MLDKEKLLDAIRNQAVRGTHDHMHTILSKWAILIEDAVTQLQDGAAQAAEEHREIIKALDELKKNKPILTHRQRVRVKYFESTRIPQMYQSHNEDGSFSLHIVYGDPRSYFEII